jgi:hypothetical protein
VAKKLYDSALFWVAMGAAMATIGGIGIAVGAIGLAPHEPLREPWFIIGAVLAGLGVLGLDWALVLFLAHRHAENHIAAAMASPPPPNPDKRIVLNDYRRRGAELAAGPPDEARAQEWSDSVVKFLSGEGWPWADVKRFQNAGTGTAANRLRPRVDVLGALIDRLGSGAFTGESARELRKDGQIGVEPDAIKPSDSEGEE